MRFGEYEIHGRVGTSSASRAVLATRTGEKRKLILKRFRAPEEAGSDFARVFFDEARLLSTLRHPNVLPSLDAGLVGDQYFTVREHAEGRDLSAVMRGANQRRALMPTDVALYVGLEVLSALAYVHTAIPAGPESAPALLRVDPSRIFATPEGRIVTAFSLFGLGGNRGATDAMEGDFGYLAPEQVAGEALDQRLEVFVVGVLLYEMLAGQRLFTGSDDVSVLERVREAIIYPAPKFFRPDLAPDLEQVLLRSLARDPASRFATAEELSASLRTCANRSCGVAEAPALAAFIRRVLGNET